MLVAIRLHVTALCFCIAKGLEPLHYSVPPKPRSSVNLSVRELVVHLYDKSFSNHVHLYHLLVTAKIVS